MNKAAASPITLPRILAYLRRNRQQIIIFLVCLGISVLLWLMIKLNRYYVHNIAFSVNLSGLFENQKLIPLQRDTVVLEIKAQGYQLLFNEVTMANTLEIDLNKAFLRQSTRPGILYISSQSLLARIATQLPVSTELLSIKPDTLFFRMEDIETRKIAVTPNLQLDFKNPFNLYDSVSITPDSVLIRGDQALVDAISSIMTRKLDVKQIEKSFSFRLNLINPYPGQLEIIPKEVIVTGKVSRFIEKTYNLPLTYTDSIFRQSIPSGKYVEIKCSIPLEENGTFNPSSLTAIATSVVREGDVHYLKIEAAAPPFVKNIRLNPDRIPLEENPAE
jgi:hypothetical protein